MKKSVSASATGISIAEAVLNKTRPIYEKYGETKATWDSYKVDARTHMIERARTRGMITYGDLAAKMETISLEPHDPKFWAIIGDVASDEAAAGRGLLSVVVVHKGGDMEPGTGFFELAKHYGRKTANRAQCFIDELHTVHAQWSIKK